MSYKGNKSILQQNLKTHLEDAAYQAFMTSNSGVGDFSAVCDNNCITMSRNFAKKFAEILAPKLTDDIFNFCMSIEIIQTPASPICPSPAGPPVPISGACSTTAGDFKVM